MNETIWQRLTHGARRICAQADWVGFVGPNWVERIMGVDVTDHFHAKQGRSTGRWILRSQGRNLAVYLKRHYALPWWRGLLAALWPNKGWSPAVQEWRHLEWARDQGLPVPRAVAAGEYIGPWGKLQSFLAVEELTGMLALHEAVPAAARNLDALAFGKWKHGLIAELARLTRALHERRHFHKDLYLCHFFIPEDCLTPVPNWRGQVHLIDLHRLRHHGWSWPVWLVKDLAQLLYSSEINGIHDLDRLRFWRAYWGGDWRGRTARLLKRLVRFKWRRYRRHNLKKAQRLAAEPIST